MRVSRCWLLLTLSIGACHGDAASTFWASGATYRAELAVSGPRLGRADSAHLVLHVDSIVRDTVFGTFQGQPQDFWALAAAKDTTVVPEFLVAPTDSMCTIAFLPRVRDGSTYARVPCQGTRLMGVWETAGFVHQRGAIRVEPDA